MIDVAGSVLTDAEIHLLRHPLVGGVILFARNYVNPEQLAQLTAAIRALRTPPLLVAVDHEGGRVQRFRDGFTAIPPMRVFGRLWERAREEAPAAARAAGYVIGAELRAHGVDLSFTPVLDLDYGESGVIGDRAFHRDPVAVSELGAALVAGLGAAGVGAVGKHFPGHGYVRADSHLEVPRDERAMELIERDDLIPFRRLCASGLAGIMPAHVIYPKIDPQPAGFSSFWLREVLREQLAFDGLIFSDDLSMEGASVAGGVVERAEAALAAGCDMVLLCNQPEQARALLAGLVYRIPAELARRLALFQARSPFNARAQLARSHEYKQAVAGIQTLA